MSGPIFDREKKRGSLQRRWGINGTELTHRMGVLRENGWSLPAIGRLFGCHHTVALYWLRKASRGGSRG